MDPFEGRIAVAKGRSKKEQPIVCGTFLVLETVNPRTNDFFVAAFAAEDAAEAVRYANHLRAEALGAGTLSGDDILVLQRLAH